MDSKRARDVVTAAAMFALLAGCDRSDDSKNRAAPTPSASSLAQSGSAPNTTPSTVQSAAAAPAPAASNAADSSASANATDAAAAKRDPKHRDKTLKRCCGMFDAYATGFVANKGPNLMKTEFLCIDLWKQGYSLADAEEKIRKSAIRQRSYMPKFCESKYVEARRSKRSDAG